jgi:hypothetical protein
MHSGMAPAPIARPNYGSIPAGACCWLLCWERIWEQNRLKRIRTTATQRNGLDGGIDADLDL